jgi:transposase
MAPICQFPAVLAMSGKIYKRHFEGSIKSEQVIPSLRHLQHHLNGRIILIWDRARTHKSKKTQAYLAAHTEISVEELPPYVPELNPEDFCHVNVKKHLKNARSADKTEMRQILNRGFTRLRRWPDLLLSFFHTAGLSVRQLQLR